MRKTPKNFTVRTGTVEKFFERALNRARKLDRGEKTSRRNASDL
jgi:hypothetical protein